MFFIIQLIVTCGFLGKIRYMPGTIGSLLAFPLTVLIAYCAMIYPLDFLNYKLDIGHLRFLNLIFYEVGSVILLFLVGWYCASYYEYFTKQQDSKEIIIDEVVGQMLTIFLTIPSLIFVVGESKLLNYTNLKIIQFIVLFILPFGLFRFFDIIKPWPIDWLDKNIKGGLGVMIDDVAAAIFASVSHYVIIFCIINIVS